MKWIGLTGPTGAGKSTLLQGLTALPVMVVDADLLYHQLLECSQPLQDALCHVFGTSIRREDGGIHRKALGQIVFNDPYKLEQLNAITHSFIMEEMHRQSNLAEREGCQGFVIDAIRLIESGLGDSCVAIIAITAPKDIRIQRIMDRDGISEAYAKSRIESQPDDNFYQAHATYVLENAGETGGGALAAQGRTLMIDLLK